MDIRRRKKMRRKMRMICNNRLQASYTVENAVIIPLFVIIIASLILCAFYMHDSVILKCAALKTAMNVKIEAVSKGTDENVSGYTAEIEVSAVSYLKQKTLLLKDITTDIESSSGLSGKRINVNCSGKVYAVPMYRNEGMRFDKTAETDASGPGDFIRKCRAAEELYKSYVSERKGK